MFLSNKKRNIKEKKPQNYHKINLLYIYIYIYMRRTILEIRVFVKLNLKCSSEAHKIIITGDTISREFRASIDTSYKISTSCYNNHPVIRCYKSKIWESLLKRTNITFQISETPA